MKYPTLYEQASSREVLDVFKGYNHNLRIEDGQFYDTKNMTSDHYPILSPREKRGVYAQSEYLEGMIAKDALCYVDGTDFVINGYPVDMGLSVAEDDCPKTLVSMGAYVIILPDKKYINTLDTTDFGEIEASFTTTTDVTFELCRVDGEVYSEATISGEEPAEPENMDLWIDTSSTPHALKQYSATNSMWAQIATTYVKISATGIGKAFGQYDGVTISGILDESLQDLNGTMAIWDRGDDYIVVVGILDVVASQSVEDGAITIERKMPNLDFITECNNRLWGCRYGTALNGEIVNEIYACKLGDFKNWNCFMGLSTDSWAASCGTDGQFTGAITHLGYPLFFKETCMHKVYVSSTGAHQIQDTACRGVQKGCSRSLAIVNETLYYKARSAICAYDGSLPTEASYALGNESYSDAVGGAHGNKYYVNMKGADGAWNLFVYDALKDLWHKEDAFSAQCFCSCRGEMYAIDEDSGKILTMLGTGEAETKPVEWMVQTGEIGISSPDMKYISRLTIRMSLAAGSRVSFFARYDQSDVWEKMFYLTGTDLRSFSIPVRPRRCDHMKLRIEGIGEAKIYSITKTIEQGSDIS